MSKEMHSNFMRTKVIERGPGGFVFFLAFIGAAIYFIGKSNGTFGEKLAAFAR